MMKYIPRHTHYWRTKNDLAHNRAEKAEAMVEKLIEAGNALDDAVDFAWGIGEYEPDPEQLEWRAIVAEWRKETNDD